MIFVIPVSASDFDKLPKFVKVLQKFAGLRNHKAILAPTQAVSAGMEPYKRILADLFGSLQTLTVTTPPAGVWPEPCNHHFQYVVQGIQSLVTGPWMWMELDSCPLVEGWADALERQHQASGRPFMGVLRDTSEVNDTMDGQHMVGFGIYPADLSKYSSLWRFPSPVVPFDVFMRYDVTKHAHNTNLIAHFWSSRGYQPDLTGLDNRGNQVAIPASAVICHGVKDESLHDIILGDFVAPEVKQPIPQAAPPPLLSLEQMADLLRKAGYFVVTPEAASQIIENPEDLIPSPPPSTETLSTQPDDLQGDPAIGHSLQPSETKAVVESNATKVQLPKRVRPRKLPV